MRIERAHLEFALLAADAVAPSRARNRYTG
jgi:hypothetical protein